jgi:hypothetical protein
MQSRPKSSYRGVEREKKVLELFVPMANTRARKQIREAPPLPRWLPPPLPVVEIKKVEINQVHEVEQVKKIVVEIKKLDVKQVEKEDIVKQVDKVDIVKQVEKVDIEIKKPEVKQVDKVDIEIKKPEAAEIKKTEVVYAQKDEIYTVEDQEKLLSESGGLQFNFTSALFSPTFAEAIKSPLYTYNFSRWIETEEDESSDETNGLYMLENNEYVLNFDIKIVDGHDHDHIVSEFTNINMIVTIAGNNVELHAKSADPIIFKALPHVTIICKNYNPENKILVPEIIYMTASKLGKLRCYLSVLVSKNR